MRNEKILDSELVKEEIEYIDDLTRIERLKSMLLDHFIMCLGVVPIFILPFILGLVTGYDWIQDVIILLCFGIYLNKDSFRGRSPAKRILGQVVVNITTGEPAGELKCTIRNFTDIFWIFEVIIILFNPNRRIGDLIAGTKVVRAEKEYVKTVFKDFQKANKKNLILTFGIAVFYVWIVFKNIG